MSGPDDVAQWAADALADVDDLELAPWQVDVLEALYRGQPWPNRHELELRSRAGRRREWMIHSLIGAALAGERIAIAASSEADARRLLEAATIRLEQALELLGRPVPAWARAALDEATIA